MSSSLTLASPSQLEEHQLHAWRGLLRVHATLVKQLDAELEEQHGLPLTSYEVLLYLEGAKDGRMRMCDLASSILLSRSGLTRLVDRLERDGLIERMSCTHDARGAYAVLTPEGRQRLSAARETHLAGVRRHFLEHFSDQELEMLGRFWDRLTPEGC